MKIVKSIDNMYSMFIGFVRRSEKTVGFRKEFYRKAKKNIISSDQKKQIRDFYAPYGRVSTVFHNYYYTRNGVFSVEYLPSDLYMNYVDKYFNNAKKAVVFENKCYFKKLFSGVKQPHMICCRMNGYWYNSEYEMLGSVFPANLLCDENEVVIKQAVGSSGGHAVFFVDNMDKGLVQKASACIDKIKEDIVVQRIVVQHEAYGQFNERSLNSLRVVSLLDRSGEAKVYSIVLRMGVDGMRVDNESSGGVNCGVQDDGYLRKTGYSKAGKTFTSHPTSGIRFAEVKLPHLEEVKNKVRELHKTIPDFRLVSWDFAVDKDGEPVLIEANLNTGGIHINQINNGPLFGQDTKKILDEVFSKG